MLTRACAVLGVSILALITPISASSAAQNGGEGDVDYTGSASGDQGTINAGAQDPGNPSRAAAAEVARRPRSGQSRRPSGPAPLKA